MRVRISYQDTQSFNMEEVITQAKREYGKGVSVEVYPDSNLPHDMLYFAIQQMITQEQLSLLFDNKSFYESEIKKLRSEILYKVEEILDSVIIDNEGKAT